MTRDDTEATRDAEIRAQETVPGVEPGALAEELTEHGPTGMEADDVAPRGVLRTHLLIGQGTSFIGSMLTQVAVPVQVYALTKSSLVVGLVGLAGLVPIVVFGIYGGAIADAMDRRLLYFLSSVGTWLITDTNRL